MLFSSLEFLLFFMPLVILVNLLLPKSIKNYWLLLCSLFFYAFGEPKFVIVMIGSIIINYIVALAIGSSKKKIVRKTMLIGAVILNLGILFVYKYMNFVTHTVHSIFPSTTSLFEETSIVLPIGISFFTFQAMSYVIDVYRGIPAQKNPFYLGLYISFFPQLIAGPIVRYTTIMDQIKQRTTSLDDFTEGMIRFLRGFNKKVLLSNLFAEIADASFGSNELSISMAWLGAICYALQIFFDFSGYSDMAIGLGRIFGFRFLENFDYPYISKTITEFWRRWHISLGTWFRDYLYFPMGGSRVKSKFRLVFNLSVVWLATGIWHGASWNFILWGVLYGVVIIVEKLFGIPQKVEKKAYTRWPYYVFTMFLVLMGWVLFRAPDLNTSLYYMKAMFGLTGNPLFDGIFVYNIRNIFVILFAGILCSTPIFKKIRLKVESKGVVYAKTIDVVSCLWQILLFVVGVSFLVMDAHNPFIYFNF